MVDIGSRQRTCHHLSQEDFFVPLISRRNTLVAAAVLSALAMAPGGTAVADPTLEGAADASSAVALSHSAAPSWSAGTRAYFVITSPNDVARGRSAVEASGGAVFAAYDAIGVLVAHSTSAGFANKVRVAKGVQQVGATRTSDVPADAYNPAIPATAPQRPVTEREIPRWDMTQIKADQAWRVTSGSASVKVGVLDTGVDDRHQDLAPNFNAADSVSCAYGKADKRHGAWRDIDTHGTHVAGTIAAAKNGKGIVGVAPGVRISSVRIAEQPSGLFFPENTVCGFMWAGDRGFDVTNNSYYTDPWEFNCPDDKDQAAIIEGVRRAQEYAERKGSLQVAAAGNSSVDLANKSVDEASPNDSTPVHRRITNACIDIPTELPGVVTVSATGTDTGLASYSNYGDGIIDVAAPGGTSGGGVYSTFPGGRYEAISGTSMAAPHVAGVAALLASANPGLTPAQIRDRLDADATDRGCASDGRCTGRDGDNNLYGQGIVDALKAVGGKRR